MADNDLRKLSRTDLLEMLLALRRENEQLHAQVADLQARLDSRQILIDKSGSIAEASLQLNGVFEAAQEACRQYVENVEQRSRHQEELCRRMEAETAEKCARMVAEAKAQSQAYWDEYMEKCRRFALRNPSFAFSEEP